jgi:antitoxin ParD1/3/4
MWRVCDEKEPSGITLPHHLNDKYCAVFANTPYLQGWTCTYLQERKGIDMNVSVGERWEAFVDGIVREGRYGSASEVVREGLRLVEEREAKLKALRTMLDASIAAGGEPGDADIDSAIEAKAAQLAKEGF